MKASPMVWTGRMLTGLFALFMLGASITPKFMGMPIATQTLVDLGWTPDWVLPIGLMEFGFLALYLYPRTSVLGAVMMTGLLGGARRPRSASTAPCSATSFSASISASSCGAGCGCGTSGSGRCSPSGAEMEKFAAASPDAYVAGLTGWQKDRVTELRAAVRAAGSMDEVIKWGHLVYLSNGPVCLIRAEGKRVLFGLWR